MVRNGPILLEQSARYSSRQNFRLYGNHWTCKYSSLGGAGAPQVFKFEILFFTDEAPTIKIAPCENLAYIATHMYVVDDV